MSNVEKAGMKKSEGVNVKEEFELDDEKPHRLYRVKGDSEPCVRQMCVCSASLNDGDSFVLEGDGVMVCCDGVL